MSELRHHSAVIPPSLAGHRLDQALAVVFDDYSRSQLKTWINDGQVTVDGVMMRPRDHLIGGELVTLTATIAADERLLAEEVDFKTVYQDADVIVIDKPAGIVVHPGAGNSHLTLVNGLLYAFPELGILSRAGLVHRIDKDTSGLLIVARTPRAYQTLVRQMANREITRNYEAITNGVFVSGGRIDLPIGRDHRQRTKMRVTDSGRQAVTHYAVIKKFRKHTHLHLTLETGRTHQIRVHMAHLGYPIVADTRYGARRMLPPAAGDGLIAALAACQRQALHAGRLAFDHPLSKEPLHFDSPLPADMQQLLSALESDLTHANDRA